MTMQQYCLRWNNHQPNFISVFSSLLTSESLVDVTLAAEGRHLQAHKVVLSACSSYFQSLFTVNPCQHPIVILKDVQFADLKVMVDFMYYGEVNVSHDQLPYILKTAEMLKIKGLAEIPVDQSVTKHNNSVDRAELLTPGESNWSSDGVVARQTITSSPCPLSPSSRRKRLRKSSTGSGSGSTERPPDEQQSTGSELLLTSVGNVVQTVIKSDPGSFTSDGSSGTTHKMKQHSSSDSEILRGSSHESVEEETTHQITLQVPQHEMTSSISHNIESSSMEIPGPSSTPSQQQQQSSQQQQQQQQQQQPPITEKSVSTTHAQLSQQLSQNQQHMGTKRGRFLIRQPRVKRESDPSQAADGDPAHAHYLSVPPLRVERQCSEPLPAHSPPPGNLLTVPGAILVKQHSHPLLPSQIQQPSSPPLQIQLIPQSRIADTAERATSPVVIINDFTNPDVGLRTDAAIAPTTTLRVRTDELKRSASSPQSSTRSSHCPVVRPGPALGCNYCWNTVDNHGRILRRKTKYHCPECQTNLCIVPCFQEYHERAQTQTDPIALTTSVMRMFPKTTSM